MDAAEWDQRYAGTELVWSAEPNRFVAAELADLPPGRALDLAAGEGRNAIWLAARGWRAVAVDFSAVAIDKGRRIAERAGIEVDWGVADVLAYRPEAASFDAVLIAYLHIPPADFRTVLDRARTALAPGGVLLVIGHDLTNITDGVGGPQHPELLYTPEAITAHLDGLHVDRAERARRPVAGDAGTKDAIDTVVRAHRPAHE
ncbi:MAG: methyltransferase [Actinobacteria bacterium 13_2_20CM_2_71_6]|nr:MAG: methyltransferase [Actinobacteria bacterium 13_2_20CM_2_71_6]